jgi:hypothetical protein
LRFKNLIIDIIHIHVFVYLFKVIYFTIRKVIIATQFIKNKLNYA